MKVTMRVEGLRDIERALLELPKSTAASVARRVLKKRAQPIADHAESLARFKSGELKRSITVSTVLSRRQKGQAKKLGKSAVEVYVGPGPLVQAITEEFGTVNQAPHPFLRPAWDSGRTALIEGIKADLWDEIRKAAARFSKKTRKVGTAAVASALGVE